MGAAKHPLLAWLCLTCCGRTWAVPSVACPDVQQGTLQVCDRCVHDDLCKTDTRLNIKYKCHDLTKKCVDPAWNNTEVLVQCPEDPLDPKTWGAQCKFLCTDQQAPFACAQRCVNEEFPCNWAPGCGIPFPTILEPTSLACLRSCEDHNDMLRQVGYDQTCSEIIARFGCEGGATLALNIPEFCPVSCNSPECPYRCSRDWKDGGEVPNTQQQRCWTQIDGGLPCLDAIKLGQDCHCKCAAEYIQMSLILGRKPGALSISDRLEGKDLSLNLEAIVGRTITLDFTGERMRSEDASNAQGRWTGSSFAHKDGWTHQQKPLQFDFPESNLIKSTQNSLLES